MLITKNIPFNLYEDVAAGEKIYIDKEVSLDANYLEIILQRFPNANITIVTSESYANFSSDVLYNHEELEILTQNVNLVRTKYNRDITFDDEFSIEQAIEASRKLNDWEKLINEATINGKPLSPLEKYMLAYSLVSKRYYKLEKEGDSTALSRNIISVLNDDYICCAGFANTLANLCARIGIPCSTRTCAVWGSNELENTPHWENHSNCIVRIEDDKYDVHGFFNADPTWDAIKSKYADQIDEIDFNFNFKHFLIPHNAYEEHFTNIVLDKAVTADEKYQERKPKQPVQINEIHCLFPDIKTSINVNTTVYNPQTHKINFELLKQQTIKRIIEIIDTFDVEQSATKTNIRDFAPTFETMIGYFLQESFAQKPDEKKEYISYLKEYFSTLLCHFSKDDLKKAFKNQISNISDDELLRNYQEFLSYENIENHYDKYYYEFVKRRTKTEPLSNETLLSLFKNVFPVMFNFEDDAEKNQFCDEILKSFSPAALLAKQKTPQ